MSATLRSRLARMLRYWEVRRAAVDYRDEVQLRFERWAWRRLAMIQRSRRRNTTFVAVTGSVGKTMATELTISILGHQGKVARAPYGLNQPMPLAQAIARVQKAHRYAVYEVGLGKQGQQRIIERSMALIRPSIAVVTTVGDDHISAYGSRDVIAREKSKVVEAVTTHGVVVLNADDERVIRMRPACKGRILTYGRHEDADVRATNVDGRWPGRLQFDVHYDGVTMHVTTQLCGEHGLTAALAAISASIAAGMPLPAVVGVLPSIPPAPQRMFPVTRGDVTFVRDDWKAPLWTMPAALDFLATARATRKILVVGTLSDYAEHRTAYVSVARQARGIADHTIFFGQWAWHVDRERQGRDDEHLQCFNSLDAARRCLHALLRPGTLVLLKGHEDDHMERFLQLDDLEGPVADGADIEARAEQRQRVIVVGLGNPGERYSDTRHNVGHAVVERLAARSGAQWDAVDGGRIVRDQRDGVEVILVKLDANMNVSGPALRRADATLGLRPERTILVHDEVKLDLGRIRGRLEGGDGGHLGARSVLGEFEDHRFRRVKVGVGMPPPGRSLTDHVLGRFDETEQAALTQGLDAACEQVLRFAREIAKADHAAV
jgi:UDP-N-acetylmuramoyl-tripeptide--D-alanyl-D-alanine ligase